MLPITLAAAAAAAAGLAASLSCEPLEAPGRLRCALVAEATGQAVRIDWSDAVIVRTPAFLQPLKGRFASSEAELQKERLLRWSLALVAKSEGKGELVVRVRALLCEPLSDERFGARCTPATFDVSAAVRVGPP